jgi:hypothetical protein
MEPNFYILNLQIILYIAGNLHKKGYENLRIVPSMSPSGLSWRCSFVANKDGRLLNLYASTWIQEFYEINDKEIELSIQELTDSFIEKENEFLQNCIGKNEEYVKWFENVLQNLKERELPYAFAEYFLPTSFWKTSLGNEIKIIPGDEKYCDGY